FDHVLVAKQRVVVHEDQQRRAGARDAQVARAAVRAHAAHDLDLVWLPRLAAHARQQRRDIAVERGDDQGNARVQSGTHTKVIAPALMRAADSAALRRGYAPQPAPARPDRRAGAPDRRAGAPDRRAAEVRRTWRTAGHRDGTGAT